MSGAVYGGDEVGTIVMDIGSNSYRIGYAGEDMPRLDFPTVSGITEENNKKNYNFDINYFKYNNLEIINPLKEAMIENWELFENQIEYIYNNNIKSPSHQSPVLMTEAAWNIRQKREKLTELMFEKFKIPAFFLSKNSVLSCLANGKSSGLVLDSGSILTSAIPVYDGIVVQQGIIKSPLAGEFILLECKKMLQEMKINIFPRYMIQSKQQVAESQQPKWTKRKPNPPSSSSSSSSSSPDSPSFRQQAIKEILKDFASQTLQVSDQPYDETLIENMPTYNYEFPNGHNIVFGQQRFRVPEGLFDPSIIKDIQGSNSMLSMSHVVSSSIGFCDIDIKPSLYSSVIVCGGNSLFNGFVERLSRDLSTRSPPSMKLKVIASPVLAERRFSSWIGGSILASLGSFQHMWISKQDYEETGPAIVEKKCT